MPLIPSELEAKKHYFGLPSCPVLVARTGANPLGGFWRFFIASGGADSKVFLVTARYVIFKPDKDDNKTYERKNASAPREDVVVLGDEAYKSLVRSIMVEIVNKGISLQTFKKRLEAIEGKEGTRFDRERTQVQSGITTAEEAIEELTKLHEEAKRWEKLDDRVIGHVVYAPPITLSADPDGYTEDFALIEIDTSRFDASNIKSNCIDLGTKISDADFTRMMYPDATTPHTIIPYDSKSGTFSAKGISGSVVVDARDRIGSLLTGRDGATQRLDPTFVTPIDFLMKRIKAWKDTRLAHLNPQLY
ncbi:hypothetical protein DAEQUDRAFT_763993 [Daedalea quercina L-15889]|uniref:Uncharacterized protein n=1 Tax=Daedalea quercina L-15889 TaxID=1314783 RepID=A0A165S1B2_9APHY|nr:hypothetical protein DAEQUDRAFT_763993 [Daedalea quercina L-15889]